MSEKTEITTLPELLELIPQRPPMVMIDAFTGTGEGVSRTQLTVAADNLFCEAGRLTECGVIEHIAQSAAARVGYLFRKRGEEVPIGFIGAVNDLKVNFLPEAGDTMETCVTVLQEVLQITLIEARTEVRGRTAASCKLKIFLQ